MTARRGQPPGFRFDSVDGIVLAALALLSAGLASVTTIGGIFWVPVYVGVTFFLFCNVFRIGNKLEPLWYVPFVIVAVYCLDSFDLELFWQLVLWGLEPWKWLLISYAIVRGPCRGIGARPSSSTNTGR